MRSGETLLIRADAGPEIGTGHVMRCMALAAEWITRAGAATFLSHAMSDGLRARVEATGALVVPVAVQHPDAGDIAALLETAERLGAAWVVTDGYRFDPDYHRAIRASCRRLLVVDDTAHLARYHADAVLNQNLGAEGFSYRVDTGAALLLGPSYALLRPEFTARRDFRREIAPIATKVLVTMGGSDPANVTCRVLEALDELDADGLLARVIVGAESPWASKVRDAAVASRHPIQVLTNVADMPEQMAWADLAVTAAGSTCWELAFVGVPSVVLVTAENQEGVADGLAREGAAVVLGDAGTVTTDEIGTVIASVVVSADRRAALSARMRRLVDGRGAERVVSHLCNAVERYGSK